MSEVLIFAFGSVLFVITSSATFAFALTRFHEVQMDDMADSGRYPVPREDGLTEVYVSPNDLERIENAAPNQRATDGIR